MPFVGIDVVGLIELTHVCLMEEGKNRESKKKRCKKRDASVVSANSILRGNRSRGREVKRKRIVSRNGPGAIER